MRFLAASLLLASACSTPCDALVARPETCGTSPGPANAWATCEALRSSLTAKTFDPFAQCIDDAACNDANAVSRCSHAMALPEPPGPCLTLHLWGAACGLAPKGDPHQCDLYATGPQAGSFACWVTCVTAGGCPKDGDTRFARCGDPNTYLDCPTP